MADELNRAYPKIVTKALHIIKEKDITLPDGRRVRIGHPLGKAGGEEKESGEKKGKGRKKKEKGREKKSEGSRRGAGAFDKDRGGDFRLV